MEIIRDESEESIGISVYLGRTEDGFTAVSKARYSDFIVREVNMKGNIACLDSMDPPVVPAPEEVAKEKEEVDASNERKRKHPDNDDDVVDWKSISTELEDLIGGEPTSEVIDFLQSKESATTTAASSATDVKDDRHFVLLPPLTDKDKRRQLHHWVRERLPKIALSDTAPEQQIRIWHASFRTHMPNRLDHQRKSNRPPRPPANYLQFVLYKENVDTASALQLIARRVGGTNSRGGRRGRGGRRQQPQLRMGYAGNKDKRGVTAQYVTIRSNECTPQQLCRQLNGRGTVGGGGHTTSEGTSLVRVGNFEYVDEELRLGRLQGNRFDVVLRNLQCEDPGQIPQQAIDLIRKTGFINYFGTQRFGKKFDTHLIGMEVVRRDYESAIDLILSTKSDGDSEVFQQWKNRFEDVDAADRGAAEKAAAQKLLPELRRFMHTESAVVRALIQKPLDYKGAFNAITKTMRMMFMHAFQSFLWNKVASFRMEELGLKVVLGDLVLAPSKDGADTDNTASRSGLPNVHIVTEEDVKNNTFTLEDLVLPLMGAKTVDPSNACGAQFDAVLKENKLTRDMILRVTDRDFNCAGDYRKLICRPTDIDFELLQYKDELAPLIETDFMKIQGTAAKHDPDGSLNAIHVGFSLPSSSYATMFLRELMKRPTSMAYQSALQLGGGGSTSGA